MKPKVRPLKTMDEVVEHHEDFIRKVIKERGRIVPQVMSFRDRELIVVLCPDGREGVKIAMKLARKARAEWIVGIFEAYMSGRLKEEEVDTYRRGSLEKRFKEGDKSVRDVVLMVVYFEDKKKLMCYRKMRNRVIRKIQEGEVFSGYMTLG